MRKYIVFYVAYEQFKRKTIKANTQFEAKQKVKQILKAFGVIDYRIIGVGKSY